MAVDWLINAIESNKNLDFVQRMLNPGDYPVINNPDGSYSTHKMSYASIGDKYIVYPTIVNKNGDLTELQSDAAFEYAKKNKEYIEFTNKDQAEAFAAGAWKNLNLYR